MKQQHSSETSDSSSFDSDSENEEDDSLRGMPLILLGVVFLMIIIMGCIVLYLLRRRKRLRERAMTLDEIGDASYIPLASGDIESTFGNENRKISNIQRSHTGDSIYDDGISEGQVLPLQTKTPCNEGAQDETTKNLSQ